MVDAGVRARDTGGGGVTPAVAEACLIGGGGGLDAAGDEAAARDGEAAPLALLPARGRCAACPIGTALSILSNWVVI